MSRSVVIVRMVLQLTSNYRIVAFHRDNLNVGTYPDPSSSPYEGYNSNSKTSQHVISCKDYSDGCCASYMHSIKIHIRLQ